MQLLVKKETAIFLGLFIANLVVAILASFVLPEKFFYDAQTIVLHKFSEKGISGSYPFSSFFYTITGLKYLPYAIVALIQYPIIIYVLYKIGIPTNFHKINVKNLLVYSGFFMIAIFISMPSKEFITFIYVSILPFVFYSDKIPSKYKVTLSLIIIAFFGLFFRPYFLLIPIIATGMYGITLVDFKIEFGKNNKGEIILADEISPDTCRLWDSETNEKLDKDRFRRDLGGVEEAYQEVLKRLMN